MKIFRKMKNPHRFPFLFETAVDHLRIPRCIVTGYITMFELPLNFEPLLLIVNINRSDSPFFKADFCCI